MRSGRYETSGLIEDQHEPGSRNQVLRNLLRVRSKPKMDRIEAEELKRAEDTLFRTYDQDHRFTSSDILSMHKLWLGKIYAWAGNYRQVKLMKGAFPFAFPARIPRLMESFGQGPLRRHTPCRFKEKGRVIQALAEVHAELVLIHPFREGNGRIARTLSTLMALQAGLPLLDFSLIRGRKRDQYFTAVRSGLERNYKPMEEIFRLVLKEYSSGRSSI